MDSHARPHGVLFSGDLDSLLLVAVLDRVLSDGQTLNLINAAFGHDTAAVDACPDRISTIHGDHELNALGVGCRDFRLIWADCSPAEAEQVLEGHVRHFRCPCEEPIDSSAGTALWLAARGQGIVYDFVWNEANKGAYKGTIEKSSF
jgi:asparagine synthetase B (glutamine-hydrolysing)